MTAVVRLLDPALALSGIERKADWVRRDAESLRDYVRQLDSLPQFETRAEEAVDDAILALTECLLVAKLAKLELDRKRPISLAAE